MPPTLTVKCLSGKLSVELLAYDALQGVQSSYVSLNGGPLQEWSKEQVTDAPGARAIAADLARLALEQHRLEVPAANPPAAARMTAMLPSAVLKDLTKAPDDSVMTFAYSTGPQAFHIALAGLTELVQRLPLACQP